MTKLEQKLNELESKSRIGLMTHVVIGYPSLEETITTVKTMAQNGADFIELQIPFSDPLADGPTIMHACEVSLKNGTKVKDAFTLMAELSEEVAVPLLFMGYYNTIFRYGVEKFCKDASAVGASGLIFPDVPVDEESEEHYITFCKQYNMHNIQVLSPASTDERLKKNAQVASGFVYCTARQATTGAKEGLHADLSEYLNRIKKYFDIPLAVGFGISNKEHIQALKGNADIAVIGSAIVNIMTLSKKEERQKNIKDFLHRIQI